jgi:spermidine dehydrogenase
MISCILKFRMSILIYGEAFMAIKRRDFLNGTALAIIAGMTPLDILAKESPNNYYPPKLTGLRGNHPGSFENAHALGREHKSFLIDKQAVEESYDLVVVGAGISGLSAAYFYHKKNKDAKILILDNHDDFGGHAIRNEFDTRKNFILGYGGSESLQSPKSQYEEISINLLKELGVGIDELGRKFNRNFYPDLNLSRGVFFDRENFQQDKLVSGDPGRNVSDDIDFKRLNGRNIKDFINDFPMSESDRKSLIKLHVEKIDYLPKMSKEEKVNYLEKTSYYDFLMKNVGLSKQAIKYFLQRSNDFEAISIDGVSAFNARVLALPGLEGMGLPELDPDDASVLYDPYIYHFPDGNSSIARLLVSHLIPKATGGKKDMNSIILAKVNYKYLDEKDSFIKLRLNSTVVNVQNVKNPLVDIGYLDKPKLNKKSELVKIGNLHRIQAKKVIMAGYNMMIPYIVNEIPQEQKEALSQNVKAPLVYTNVVISNWKSFKKLGVHEIYSACLPYSRIKLDYPVDIGGYQHPRDPEKPICLHMVYVPTFPNKGMDARTQSRAGRYKLLTTPFSVLENDIRSQLQRMLGPTGFFDHKKDILAITVNRWAHGYSYAFNSLFDDEEKSNALIKLARKPFGNIAIANSDSDWGPYVNVAIEQANRAVNEITS